MDRYNAEGYPDPTAYSALLAVQREEKAKPYLPLVYIASLFLVKRNSEKNRAKIRTSPFGNPKKIAGHFCLMRACFMR